MKKIFSFAAALLFGMSMMATEYEWTHVPSMNFWSEDNAVVVRSALNLSYEQKQMASDDATNKLFGIKIGGSANTNMDTAYIQIDCGAEITELELGVSNCSTNAGVKYAIVFCQENQFTSVDQTVLTPVVATSINRSVTSDNHQTITVPEGAQSLRIYRKVRVNGTDYGAGTSVDLYYLRVVVGQADTKYTVTYMNGETTLGTEKVVEGATPAKYEDYQTVAGSTFEGWYNEADFQTTADFTAAINADKTFYGKFVHTASSENLLKELWFSNGVKAYIVRGETAKTVKGCYMEGTAAPSVQSNIVSEGATFAQNGNTITVTAENGDVAEYALELTEVDPLSTFTSGETITFDTTAVDLTLGGYVYSVYGWDANKGVKWGKPVDDATNLRVREGKNRIYMFLPACDSVAFIGGSAGARDVEIRVNGVVNEVKKTPAKDAQILVKGFNAETANMVSFESNGSTNGDSGFTGMIIYKANTPTGINNVEAAKAVKVVRDGKVMILKGNVLYDTLGNTIK